MTSQTVENLKHIKQSFRLFMNGSASRSMRDKGLEYKINWGVSLPQLREMAMSYGKDYELAVALWKEPIRECKIMATLIMPAEQMTEALAVEWASGITVSELAEVCAFNLFQHLSFALPISMSWLCSDVPMSRLCAYHTLSRLSRKENLLDENAFDKLLQSVSRELSGDNVVMKHAAANCLTRFCYTSEEFEQKTKKMLENADIDFFV